MGGLVFALDCENNEELSKAALEVYFCLIILHDLTLIAIVIIVFPIFKTVLDI